jgi:hypothetical protein
MISRASQDLDASLALLKSCRVSRASLTHLAPLVLSQYTERVFRDGSLRILVFIIYKITNIL